MEISFKINAEERHQAYQAFSRHFHHTVLDDCLRANDHILYILQYLEVPQSTFQSMLSNILSFLTRRGSTRLFWAHTHLTLLRMFSIWPASLSVFLWSSPRNLRSKRSLDINFIPNIIL